MCDFRSAPEWSSWVPMIPVPTFGVASPVWSSTTPASSRRRRMCSAKRSGEDSVPVRARALLGGLAVLAPRSGVVWHILVQTEHSTVVGPQHTDQIVVSLGLTNVG
jgi:hypothetical protein